MDVKGLEEVIRELNNIEHNLSLKLEGLDGHHVDFDDVDVAISHVGDALESLQAVVDQ